MNIPVPLILWVLDDVFEVLSQKVGIAKFLKLFLNFNGDNGDLTVFEVIIPTRNLLPQVFLGANTTGSWIFFFSGGLR